jgi:transcription initiation factor IIF auxiliary subunit
MENATTTSSEVARVAVRLPPFWPECPDVWFSQTDSQFAIAGITSETTKFHYVVSQLEQKYAAEVDDLITSPPQDQPYSTLRSTLLTRLSPSIEQHHQLLHHEEMGDRKPSQFLQSSTMEKANTTSSEVARVAVRLPPFWPERPDVWFSQTDSQFAITGITSETTKFHYVISQLEQTYAAEVDDLITSPPQDQPYTTLRSTLLTRLSPSTEQ